MAFDVARLDDTGTLRGVDTVAESDWTTDHSKKRVQLPPYHDMRNKIGVTYWDWNAGTFFPIEHRQDIAAQNMNDNITSILVKAAEKLHEKGDIQLTEEETNVLAVLKSRLPESVTKGGGKTK